MVSFKNIKYIIKILKNALEILTLFLTLIIYFSSNWIKKTYDNISLNEICFHLFSPVKGTEKTILYSYINKSIIPSLFYSIIIIFLIYKIHINIIKNKNLILGIKKLNFINILEIVERNKDYILNFSILKKKLKLKIKKNLIKIFITILKFCFIFTLISHSIKILNLEKYFDTLQKKSNFIKENYVDPKKIKLSFPKKKRNLIYIFIESFESSFFSKELGGNEKENLLEPLLNIMETGINFSNSKKYGGAYSVSGTTFTTAGIVSQSLGIPLKIKPNIINYNKSHTHFFKNIYGLGNILEKEGYQQFCLIGSDKKFGNRDILMKEHGNYKIFDYYTAIQKKYINPKYKKWWGFEDDKLFKIAKEKLLKLQNKNIPFNLTILTSNTHFPDGYIEEGYIRKFQDRYSDAIYCSCLQIENFIEWLKKQKLYENTTVVLCGDHLSMDKTHFAKYNKSFKRTIFNLFLNSKTKPISTKNRVFTSFDMFPSTLASMGVKIEREQLGLGVNLFSNKKTLAEQYGIDYINKEIQKENLFYNLYFNS